MKCLLKSVAFAAVTAFALPVAASAEDLKLGLVTTLTTSAGAGGEATRRGVELALDELGYEMAGREVELLVEDDGLKPELGKQKTEKLILQDKVDFLLGYNYSNVLLASYPTAVQNETFILSSNAGPQQLAGNFCNPWFFAVGFQNGQAPAAVGQLMNDKGHKTVYAMAPNYAAGRDMVEGMQSTFEGEVLGTSMTKWPDQLDFSSEIANIRAASPEAVFVFYPPAHALQFVKQYQQAGLKDSIPLYSVYTFDALTIPTIGESSVGAEMALFWSIDLPNEANQNFVETFMAKYDREPSNFAATAYDTVMLIDSVVEELGGDLSDKDAVREALRRADFSSVRGNFEFGPNHFPIHDFYQIEVVAGENGQPTTQVGDKILTGFQDVYAPNCTMN